MEILEVKQVNDALAEMVALFRVELRSYKGIASKPNIEAGREEMEEYLSVKFLVFAALVDGEYAGYVVCRVDSGVVWVESIFVKEEYRRQGVATALHSKAEEIAASYTDIVFPENDVRFIAINDNVDSAVQTEFDMTPIRNFCNELYARDTAKKIKSTFKMKGESGKHLSSNPPFGYVKDEKDKDKWLVDEKAAEVVRYIFKLCES